MDRLGESYEWGSAIAALFPLAGWQLERPLPAFGGGTLFYASRVIAGQEVVVKRCGASFVDVAADLLNDALSWEGPRVGDVQLELPVGAG